MIAQNRGRDVSEIADDGLNQLNLLLNECIFHSSLYSKGYQFSKFNSCIK